MEHVLTEHGFRLLYLRDSGALGELDREAILTDLLDSLPPGEPAPFLRFDLREYDHLVIASDLTTGRNLGLLCGINRATPRERLLVIDTAFVVAETRGQHLMRRMIALMLLRMAGIEALPDAVVTLSQSTVFCHVLSQTAGAMRSARFLPEPAQEVIRFEPAALMHRIASSLGHRIDTGATRAALHALAVHRSRGVPPLSADLHAEHAFAPIHTLATPLLAAIDLRHAQETELMEDARQLYRARPPRQRPITLPSLERNPFWPAAMPERSCPAQP